MPLPVANYGPFVAISLRGKKLDHLLGGNMTITGTNPAAAQDLLGQQGELLRSVGDASAVEDGLQGLGGVGGGQLRGGVGMPKDLLL